MSRILVVENDASYRTMLEEFFVQEGYPAVATDNITDARRIMDNGDVDLAVIDIRLISDEDDKDISGLELAKASNPQIPKIILTAYPGVELVRTALTPNSAGVAPAIGFVSKEEGLEVLLRHVRFALMILPASIGNRIKAAFGVLSNVALPDRILKVGIQDATERILTVLDSARLELCNERRSETTRAIQYHYIGLVGVCLGVATVVTAGALLMLGHLSASIASLVSSLAINVMSALVFTREDRAHARARDRYDEMDFLNRTGFLLEICNTIESAVERDQYRMRIIDQGLARSPKGESVAVRPPKAKQARTL